MNIRTVTIASILTGVLPLQVQGARGIADDPIAAAAISTPAQATQISSFTGQVDHAAAGCGFRNFDSCTIRLRGIPANSTVVRASLNWAQICSGTTCPATVPIEFQGRTINSTLIAPGPGTCPQPCWAGTLLGAYQVDVTGLMPATTTAAVSNKIINGDYLVSAIPSNAAERDGRDPFLPATTNLPKAEGATLVVVYSNPSLSAAGRVYIHKGCDFFSGTLNVTNAISPVGPSPVTAVKFTRFGADGQVGSSTNATPAISNENTFFGGPAASCPAAVLPQIAGNGSIDNQNSDWNGNDGEPLNQLWDTHTSSGLSLGAGAGSYCVRYVSGGDCMVSIGYVLTLR